MAVAERGDRLTEIIHVVLRRGAKRHGTKWSTRATRMITCTAHGRYAKTVESAADANPCTPSTRQVFRNRSSPPSTTEQPNRQTNLNLTPPPHKPWRTDVGEVREMRNVVKFPKRPIAWQSVAAASVCTRNHRLKPDSHNHRKEIKHRDVYHNLSLIVRATVHEPRGCVWAYHILVYKYIIVIIHGTHPTLTLISCDNIHFVIIRI